MSRREKLQQMLQDSPDDPFLLYALAMEHQSSEEWEASLSAFDRVIEVDPNSVAAYFQKGQILARLERTDESQAVLRSGIDVGQKVGDDHAVAEMTEFLQSL